MIEIDARGLSCPIPVVKTKKILDSNPEDEVIVLVDSEVSKENVSRLASAKGYSVESGATGDEFRLVLRPRKSGK